MYATGTVANQLGGEIVSYAFLIILKFFKGDELLKPVPVFSIIEYWYSLVSLVAHYSFIECSWF